MLTRRGPAWTGRDLELADVEDLDGVVDLLRDLATDGGTTLLFVEEDDEYIGIVRFDGDEDPRAFISDRRAIEAYELAGRIFGDTVPVDEADPDPDPAEEDEEEDNGGLADAVPAGDPDLLVDLGTSVADLLRLCAEEGMLPSDVTYTVCEKAGCVDVLEEVRGGI
ncbi:MAG: tRNA adenosine deaminase-associated protein [Mycobacteriales bacterium]